MNILLDEARQLFAAENLRQLNPYAVALRYEGSEVLWVTETQAVEMVEALHAWVKKAVEQEEMGGQ